MTVTNEQEWRAAGSPWTAAPAIAMFAEIMRGHGFTVYTIGDEAHLSANPPEDHTPYSATPWPDAQPYPYVLAMDIQPGGAVDWHELGEEIVAAKNAARPGTEWIKYINFTDRHGACWHASWEPDGRERPSTDTGHIHISARSDRYAQTDFHGWDPVAEILGGTTPAPAPAGPTPTEDIVKELPLLQKGSTGQPVGNLQALLNAHGANPQLRVDQDFGPLTDSAVRAFQVGHQVANSVTAAGTGDGQVGAHTWAALLDVA